MLLVGPLIELDDRLVTGGPDLCDVAVEDALGEVVVVGLERTQYEAPFEQVVPARLQARVVSEAKDGRSPEIPDLKLHVFVDLDPATIAVYVDRRDRGVEE